MNSPFAWAPTLLVGALFPWFQSLVAQALAPVVLTATPAPAGVRPALARDATALADPVREAMRTLWSACRCASSLSAPFL